MDPPLQPADEQFEASITRGQIDHFRSADPRCRALQLPEGILLRYTLSRSLYFHLRTGVRDGKITTAVYASDSPYDWSKVLIGEVDTPMFQAQANQAHLRKLEGLLREWVSFVKEESDAEQAFTTFTVKDDER